MYFQLIFVLDRVKALAPQHPEWKDKESRRSDWAGVRDRAPAPAALLSESGDRSEHTVKRRADVSTR